MTVPDYKMNFTELRTTEALPDEDVWELKLGSVFDIPLNQRRETLKHKCEELLKQESRLGSNELRRIQNISEMIYDDSLGITAIYGPMPLGWEARKAKCLTDWSYDES